MACSTKFLKVFAVLWDIIYLLFGVIVIGLGVHIIIRFEHFNTAAYVIIAVGVVIVLASLFGTLSAIRESSRMIKSFVVFVVFLIILQTITVGFFWIFQESFLINVDNTFKGLWHEQPLPIRPGNASQIAGLERWLDCCGNSGYKDYLLPPSSCYNSVTDKLNEGGCRQKFVDYIAESWTAFNIFCLVLVGVELICAFVGYVLSHSIVNRWRRSKHYPK